MWALGLDTAGTQLAVALCRAGGPELTRFSPERRAQGDVAQALITELLAEAQITLQDVKLLAVVTGPGSFTGLRVGLALAQGLSRGLAVPLAGYDAFTLLRAALGPAPVLVLDSLRDELFVERGQGLELLTVPALMPLIDGRPCAGDGTARLIPPPEELPHPPLAVQAAQHALADAAAGRSLPTALPFYGRAPDISMPKSAL